MKKEKLIVLSLKEFRTALKPMIEEHSKAALLNLEKQAEYRLENNKLVINGIELNEEELVTMVANPKINHPIGEPLLVYGLWSYLYFKFGLDLQQTDTFEIDIKYLEKYLHISNGKKGYNLVQKLEGLKSVCGVLIGKGIYPLVEVLSYKNCRLVIKVPYFYHLMGEVQKSINFGANSRKYWYVSTIDAGIVNERNKIAALIVIELALLIGIGRTKPNIAIYNLARKVPRLRAKITDEEISNSSKNRILKRTFSRAWELLEEKTAIYEKYLGMKAVRKVIPTMKTLDEVIRFFKVFNDKKY